ncbi:UDP-glycosyltransferase 91A1 [Apostasia shenzhenica]|uniref:UDP-glycosyltransferase 91A1 n=1 Tax=Apostasia shenzhenica TaxID=1088818 RepID=A0A2I0BGA6_9ASPA|nr:UDP-glycosyltransferase 91A1 [Apostasia shenzhenica]
MRGDASSCAGVRACEDQRSGSRAVIAQPRAASSDLMRPHYTAGSRAVARGRLFEQGLNARLLEEKGLGFEVVRGREDGLISGEEIARKLRAAMAEEEDGEGLRARARKGKEKFGGEEMQGKYMEEFVKHLWENRGGTCQED